MDAFKDFLSDPDLQCYEDRLIMSIIVDYSPSFDFSTNVSGLPVNSIMLNSHTGSHYHRMQKKQNSRWCWMLKE